MRRISGRFLNSILLLALAQGFVACSNDDDDDNESGTPIVTPAPVQPGNGQPPAPAPVANLSLVETVVSNADFSTLRLALETAGLTDVLNSGVYTVFAPTNEAFARIPAETLNALLADKEALTRVLLYHVVPTKLLAKDVLASSDLTTANELKLTVALKDGKPFINDSGILATDVLASNGVVHVIDSVLLPPAKETPAPAPAPLVSLAEIVATNPNFSTLKVALEAADLVDVLKSGSFTVFAPNDEAFAKIPATALKALLDDKEALKRVLLYHVVPNKLLAQDVLASSSLTTANELKLAIALKDGKPFVNDSGILATDVQASNGVVHVIDTVLMPPAKETPAPAPLASLADIVATNPDFSTLKAALEAAGLVDVLKSGSFTVFAPNDAAFAKIPKETLNALLADKEALTRILLYHVVPNKLLAKDVLATSELTTANELKLTVALKDGKPFINDSAILATDVLASNGVAHVIDTVLLPPAKETPAPLVSLAEIVASNPDFSTLKLALETAGLVDVLKSGSFTVFAPTNAAFAKIPEETLKAVLADKEALTRVLLYHVVPNRLLAKDVLASAELTTANELKLTVALKDGKPFINSSAIIATDVLASNGVAHVIDTVLLPPSNESPAPAPSLVDLVVSNPQFYTLRDALIAADLVDTLKQGNFTVFAPTNEAFAKIPAETLTALLADKEALTRVLLYHVVPNTVLAKDVLATPVLTSANALSLSVTLRKGKPFINNSEILATDILASNGVVHVIDSVLLPPERIASRH